MKTDVRSEHAELVRYFLGELTPEEQERLEERYMVDEEYAELRDQVELDLVDAYVSGALPPQQHQHFDLRYLITRERKATVQAAYLSKVYRDRIAEPQPLTQVEKARANPRRWFIPALAAALVLMILGSALLLLFHRKPIPDEAKSRAPVQTSSPPARSVPLPPPSAPVVTPSLPQLAKRRPPSAHRPSASKTLPNVDPLPSEPLPIPQLVIGEIQRSNLPTVVIANVDAGMVSKEVRNRLGANINLGSGMSELIVRQLQKDSNIRVEKAGDPMVPDVPNQSYYVKVNIAALADDPKTVASLISNLLPRSVSPVAGNLGNWDLNTDAEAMVEIDFKVFDGDRRIILLGRSVGSSSRPLGQRRRWVPLATDKPVDITGSDFMQTDIGQATLDACNKLADYLRDQVAEDRRRRSIKN